MGISHEILQSMDTRRGVPSELMSDDLKTLVRKTVRGFFLELCGVLLVHHEFASYVEAIINFSATASDMNPER